MSTVIDQRNHRNLCYRLAPSTSNGGLEAAPWRAVYLRPRYEAVSARFLTEKGHEVFLPTCKSRRQRSDRYVTLELPLFPGYLFCRCAEPHISSVLNTCGVLRVLGTRESPAVVNEEEIRHLATVTRAKLDLQPCAFITSGQKVTIHRGPLCGVEGIITGFDSRKQKVVVSISLLQRSAAVSLEPEWLTPQSERLMQS
jgi:transcription antitermination factor NusG